MVIGILSKSFQLLKEKETYIQVLEIVNYNPMPKEFTQGMHPCRP